MARSAPERRICGGLTARSAPERRICGGLTAGIRRSPPGAGRHESSRFFCGLLDPWDASRYICFLTESLCIIPLFPAPCCSTCSPPWSWSGCTTLPRGDMRRPGRRSERRVSCSLWSSSGSGLPRMPFGNSMPTTFFSSLCSFSLLPSYPGGGRISFPFDFPARGAGNP